jgi:uncharacterized membrane protein YcgQ (UPF0703/DUF1980 family)
MDNKKLSSLIRPSYAFILFLFGCSIFLYGLVEAIMSFFSGGNAINALTCIAIGASLSISVYNLLLYQVSIDQVANLVDQITELEIKKAKLSALPPSLPVFKQTQFTPHSPFLKSLEQMTQEELEIEKKKALSEENYEQLTKIKAEENRRKS